MKTEIVHCTTCEQTYTACAKCGSSKIWESFHKENETMVKELICARCCGLWP